MDHGLKKRKIIKKRRSTEAFGETIIKKYDFNRGILPFTLI